MDEENQPRRRRRVPQTEAAQPNTIKPEVPVNQPEQETAKPHATRPKRTPQKPAQAEAPKPPKPERKIAPQPYKIVVGNEGETPEWMVSAGSVSGAASRRTAKSPESVIRTETPEAPKKPVQLEANEPERHEAKGAKPGMAKTGTVKKAAKKPAVRLKKAKSTKKERSRKGKKIRQTVLLALCAAVLLTLVIAGGVTGVRLMDIKRTLDQGDGVFYPNLYVNGLSLQGMTLDQAADIVTRQVSDQVARWSITLRTMDGRSWNITGDSLNMKYDVADQLDQLWSYGHTGSSMDRYEAVQALKETPEKRFTTLTYDMTSVNQILQQIKAEVDKKPVNAARLDDDSVWPPYTYTDDVDGQTLDITGLYEHICGMVNRLESGTVDLMPTPVKAAVTRESLENEIQLLATYETKIATSSQPGRFVNVQIGTERFNHKIIMAGEQVSFNSVAGKRTEKNGYQTALELAYGQYVEGIGGGICQVSSTLYNCVVQAGLQVVKRTQHSLASSYVPLGQDATVSDNGLDFVFKNTSGAPIYIETKYYKAGGYSRTQFSIYGRPNANGYSYKLESVVREEIPIPEPTIRRDENAEYVVYDDETYQRSKGEKGYIVDVYLITTDKTGLEVTRVLDHTDTYKASAPVVYVGVTPRETPFPN